LSNVQEDDAVRALADAYSGSEFWWKRQQHVELQWRPFRLMGDVLSEFLALMGDALGRALRAVVYFIRDTWYLIRDALAGLVPGLGATGVTLILSATLAGLIGWVMWKVHPHVMQWLKSGDKASPAKRASALVHEELPAASLLLSQASEAMQLGRYPEAMRFAFLALLAGLQSRGALRYDRSRTNREYLNDLRDLPHLAVVFRDAAQPYERAWYGKVPVTLAEAEQLLGLCGRVVAPEVSAR
jgi:hypothetical protein